MPDPKPHHRRAAAEAEAPDVCFHVERDGKFYAYDRHSVADAPFWVAFGEPFMCQWQSANDAISAYEPGDVIRVSIDGTLYSAQAIADAEERGREWERLKHLDLTRRFLRALIVLTCEKPEHWGALREECEEVLAGTVEEFTERPVAAKIRGGFEMLLDEFQKGLSENKGGQQVTNTSAWQGAKLIPSLAREMRWYIKNYGPMLGIVTEPDALPGEQPGRLIGGGK